MCGFLGQYSQAQAPKDEFLANLATAKHRGPDQTGYWQGEGIQLGFNRLAIVDLSEAGHQPMQSAPGNWVIIFNGEIYNHQELRKELDGYPFKGHSDTETLLASFEARGFEATIKKLVGMFAIVAWHQPTEELYVARDSVGIKPFFYHNNPQNFWFGSQFNQIIKGIGKHNVQLTPEGMHDFLQFGYMHAPNTIYKNIKQLEPGQMAVVDGDKITLKRFCEYPHLVQDSGLHEDSPEALDQFNSLFAKVCQDQLQADVPVATFLSSGIDSTLVNAYAKAFKPDLTAYTIGVSGAVGDERPLAAKYATEMGIKHISKSIEQEDILNCIEDHFEKMGEPFADVSTMPTYLICKKAREDSTVMLSGDGGDELFWGYHRMYNATVNYPFYNDSLLLRKIKKKLRVFSKPNGGTIYEFEKPDESVENGHSHISIGTIRCLMPHTSKSIEMEEIYGFSGKTQLNYRNWIRYNEFYAHMQRVLIKVDRMSMAHSLEVRVPLLDQRIVEFAWNLDSNFGISKDKELKKFLKKALSQHIPIEMMNHKKMGFYVPFADWLKTSLRDDIQDMLLNNPIYGEEYIDRSVWNQLVLDFYNDKNGVSDWAIWIMYCWQKWPIQLNKL